MVWFAAQYRADALSFGDADASICVSDHIWRCGRHGDNWAVISCAEVAIATERSKTTSQLLSKQVVVSISVTVYETTCGLVPKASVRLFTLVDLCAQERVHIV